MNKRLLHREISNLIMLVRIAKCHGFKVFFWSLADGMVRRLHFYKVYEYTHYKRHECCKNYLRRTYAHVIEKYRRLTFNNIELVGEITPVWRYWHQGMDSLPFPVDITLKSSEGKTNCHPVKILTAYNYEQYVDIPEYIKEKRSNNQMNIAVFSDFLRIALLKKYGGIWLDSTFFVSDQFPKMIDKMPFYSIKQNNLRKWVVTKDLWSVCLLACGPENPLISFCYDFLAEYWKKEVSPIAYLMTDCIIAIGYEEIPAIKQLIDGVPNNNIHCFDFLTEIRNKKYNASLLEKLRKDTYIYQLSYKYDFHKYDSDGNETNFGALVQ